MGIRSGPVHTRPGGALTYLGAILQPPSDGRGCDTPVHGEAVARQAALDAAPELSIAIHQILFYPRAQARQVQSGVAALQRVERPADGFDSLLQGDFPVREFHPEAQPAIAVTGFDGH